MPRRSFDELKQLLEERRNSGGDFQHHLVDLVIDIAETVRPAYASVQIAQATDIDIGDTPRAFDGWDLSVRTTPEFDIDLETGVITANIPMIAVFSVRYTLQFRRRRTHYAVLRSDIVDGPEYSDRTEGEGRNNPTHISIMGLYRVEDPGTKFWVDVSVEPRETPVEVTEGTMIAYYVPRTME